MPDLTQKLNSIIYEYNVLMLGIEDEAAATVDRAYGGIIRAGKGKLVESITERMVRLAWTDVLGGDILRLKINKKKMPITINDGYIERIVDPRVKEYVGNNREKMIYKFGTDVQVFVDGRLVLPIECKAYAENAMIKRILFDAALMKEAVGTDSYYLVQLESQLGGDYSELNEVTYGSPSTHALMAHVPVNLEIITLLKGERNVNRPIHKPEFYKELKMRELIKTVNIFASALRQYL